jgi:predicted small lipoprotein YifL
MLGACGYRGSLYLPKTDEPRDQKHTQAEKRYRENL